MVRRPGRLIGMMAGALGVVLAVTACSAGGGTSGTPAASFASASAQPSAGTHEFTDDAGRHVRIPNTITKIAPSGAEAQAVLFTLCPDKIVGLGSKLSSDQLPYLSPQFAALPVFGSFYSGTLNMEAVMKAAPQIVIDIGEVKPDNTSDLDSIQQRTGIPTIFVQMGNATYAQAYAKLGEVTGDSTQASKIVSYINQTLGGIQAKVATIPASQRPNVYYGENDGLTAVGAGTEHAQDLDFVGATNVAKLSGSESTATISMEQLMLWNPDVILLAPGTAYAAVATSSQWQGLAAVKAGKYAEIPSGLYSWMDQPPSANQILGIVWLANLLYPNAFDFDMVSQAQTFYSLFYHYTLSDAQAKVLLANAAFKG